MHGDTAPWVIVATAQRLEQHKFKSILNVTVQTRGLSARALLFLFQSKHGLSQENSVAQWRDHWIMVGDWLLDLSCNQYSRC